METKKVLVGMSGGVDSTVCVMLLQNMGFDVSGVTFHMFDGEQPNAGAADARAAAEKLGIPFEVCDLKGEFHDNVMCRFAAEYAAGRTPNPCIICNRTVKFAELFRLAEEKGFDCVATGHYARVSFDGERGRYVLRKGADAGKDQTYVLYNLTQEQLAHVRFPVGEHEKTEIRALAGDRGLENAARPDSQDICFIPDGDYTDFLREHGVEMVPGDFTDKNGKVLGRHVGLAAYTTGQRKGLGVGGSDFPLYVLRKDAEKNVVVLGPEEELYSTELVAEHVNWVSFAEPTAPMRVTAKTRYSQNEAAATLYPLEGGRVRAVFDKPQRALTCGQSAVFYLGDEVVAGGVICEI